MLQHTEVMLRRTNKTNSTGCKNTPATTWKKSSVPGQKEIYRNGYFNHFQDRSVNKETYKHKRDVIKISPPGVIQGIK